MKTFPEKWGIRVTDENRADLHAWRMKQPNLSPSYKELKDTNWWVCSIPRNDNTYMDYSSGGSLHREEGCIDVTTEEWREHFLPKKYTFSRGDVIEFLGSHLYYVGMGTNGKEYAEHIKDNIGVRYTIELPRDYVSIGSNMYWTIRPDEKWRLVKKKESIQDRELGERMKKLYETPIKGYHNWLESDIRGQMGIYEQIRPDYTIWTGRKGMDALREAGIVQEVHRGSNISAQSIVMDYRNPVLEEWLGIRMEEKITEVRIEPLPDCIIVKKRKKNKKIIVV